jgi:signal transduction histidine kinase
VNRHRIVVVDDEPGMQRLLQRLLTPLNQEVLVAGDAESALRIANSAPVDLFVSDLRMPGMDGLALLERLRETGHDSAFILVTAFGELDAVLRARDDLRLSNFMVKPIHNHDKFLYDVNSALRQRELEVQNRSLIRELEEANQTLESKVLQRTRELTEKNVELARLSNFRADVLKVLSHELRTPMAILKGYMDIRFGDAAAGQDQPARVMRRTLERMQSVVDHAVQLRRGSESASFALALGPVDPRELCSRAVTHIQPLVANRKIEIALEEHAVPHCTWDAHRVESILEELLTNAARNTPDGSKIQVALRAAGGHVEIRVRDRGEGIPEEDRERVFEPFVTLGPAERHQSGQFAHRAQGTGLGLAVVKLWVELHGGRVTVQPNEDGVGSTFVVSLPQTSATYPSIKASEAG